MALVSGCMWDCPLCSLPAGGGGREEPCGQVHVLDGRILSGLSHRNHFCSEALLLTLSMEGVRSKPEVRGRIFESGVFRDSQTFPGEAPMLPPMPEQLADPGDLLPVSVEGKPFHNLR